MERNLEIEAGVAYEFYRKKTPSLLQKETRVGPLLEYELPYLNSIPCATCRNRPR